MSQVTNIRKVTVFGGTGFLGRRVVQHLLDHGFAVRVASRHPERSTQVLSNTSSALEFVRADVGDEGSVMTAVAGAFGVVNAVGLYVGRGNQTFRSVHVEAAARVAKHSLALGVQRLAHVSGIGADARSPSAYIRSRGEGETSVRAAFPAATIIRPAVMFGPDDAFLTSLMKNAADVSGLSHVRAGSDRTATFTRRRCFRGNRTRLRRSGSANGLRIGRSPHLYLRRAAPNGVCASGRPAHPDSRAVHHGKGSLSLPR